ncbi:hypothetical protein KFU94_65100 [Chloroflexi bacterium TSY]|nr:hypothetical protein [Chloroflexi bacterium TSY]
MDIGRTMNQRTRFVLSLTLAIGILSLSIVPVHATSLPRQIFSDWIQLSIEDIEALNVTNGEPIHDEVAAGAIIASVHGVDQVEYEELGEFEEGTQKGYDDWILADVPVSDLTDVIQIDLSLVEMDPGGGKDAHLSLLALKEFELAKAAMLTHFFAELDTIAASNQRSQLNASSSSFGALLGDALRAGLISALGSLINVLWDVLVALIADDPFKPVTIETPDLSELENSPISGQITVEDHGGKYRISYTWTWVKKPATLIQASTAAPQTDYQPDHSFEETVSQMRKAWIERLGTKTFLPIVFVP